MNSENDNDSTTLKLQSKNENLYGKDAFQNHILEQYKLYAQLLDDHHTRFMNTLKFFISIQFAFLYGFGFIIKDGLKVGGFGIIMLLIVSLTVCFVWFMMARSHLKLTSVKHETLEEIEAFLPIRPFYYEWHEKLKSGKNYISMRVVLTILPVIMAITYISLTIISFYSK